MKTGIVLVTALITVGAIGTGGFFLWDALSGGDNRAKQRETQQHTYDHAVTRIEFKLDSGTIEINPGADAKVGITRNLEWTSTKPEFREEWTGDVLRITATCPGDNCSTGYTVTVPASVAVQAETGAGDVNTHDITGDLRLESRAGDVGATNPAAALWARSKAGTLTFTGIKSPKAEFSTDSGDINAGFAVAPQSVTSSTGAGDITVTVPRDNTGYAVETEKKTGNEEVGVNRDAGSQRKISAKVRTGNITIKYA